MYKSNSHAPSDFLRSSLASSVFRLRTEASVARPCSAQALFPDRKWLRHQLRSAARPILAVGPLVVDAHVRRGRELDPDWPVRKQFGLHELGLGRAKERRLFDPARGGRLYRFAGRQRREDPGPVALWQSYVHLAFGYPARRNHARAGLIP